MGESDPERANRLSRVVGMIALIIAGEAIFGLPFHITRFFRPTMLTVFGFTNTELGGLFSFYGVVAMVAYLPGGPIADRFSARKLMTVSLVCTALVGFYLATIPGYTGLSIVFAFFGVTTILLFWAALIRATREWGGSSSQGAAFGVLDGGRGLFGAALASLALIPFNMSFGDDPAAATDAMRLEALQRVIYVYTASTFMAAVFVWFFVVEGEPQEDSGSKFELRDVARVFVMPSVWLQALLLICAYSAYKGIDNYSLYAVQVYGMNEVDGAQVSVIGSWVRPFAAVGAGLIADRTRPTSAAFVCFGALLVGYIAFALIPPTTTLILWGNVVVTCAMAFGLRGVYFAIMEEVSIPAALTGTAVGIISLIGFTPDIFVAPIAGMLLDRSPGIAGHQHFFYFLALFAIGGMVSAFVLRRRST